MQPYHRGWQPNNMRYQNPQQWAYPGGNRNRGQGQSQQFNQQGPPYTVGLKHAVCPRCTRGYDLRRRIPIILNCNHTVCKECVQTLNGGNEIKCVECQQVSGKREKNKDISEKFEPNYFLVGQLFCSKSYTDNSRPSVPTSVSYTLENSGQPVAMKTQSSSSVSSVSRKCSAEACMKESSLWCMECKENYCEKCSEKVHNSAKGLKSHKVFAIGVTMCEKHNLPKEIACVTCDDGNYCSYCFIENHNGHSLRRSTEIEDSDIPRLNTLVNDCKAVLKNLRETDKKVNTEMKATNPNKIKTSVGKCFSAIHCRLQKIEFDWNSAIAQKLEDNQKSMEQIRQQLREHISAVGDLLVVAKNVLDKKQDAKHDIKLLLAQLENARKLSYDFKYESFSPNRDIESFQKSFIKYLETNAGDFSLEVEKVELVPVEPIFVNKSEVESVVSSSSKSSVSKRDSPDPLRKSEIEKWISSVSQSSDSKTCDSDKESRSSKASCVKLNKKENVVVTHIENPHCIYVQLRKQIKLIDTLHKDLAAFVNRFIAGNVDVLETGNLYLAKCYLPQKPKWCRVRLIEYDSNLPECKVNVFYIDFGMNAKLNVADIRQLPDVVKFVPPYAYKCQIKDIYPIIGEWDNKTNDLIKEILNDAYVLMLVFEEKRTTLEVDLIAYDQTGGETSIKTTLILTGIASTYEPYDIETDVQELQMLNEESFYDGQTGINMQQTYDVVILHVNNPDSFYVQLKEHQEKLESLRISMYKYYKDIKKGFIYTPKIGKTVAVQIKVADDHCWYRGTIVDVLKGQGVVSVFLVDTGKIVSVQWDHLKKLNKEFYTTATLAIHVKLKDIQVLQENQDWSDAAINHLLTYKDENRVLKMIPYNSNNLVMEVTLFEVYSREHICVNSLMVSNGLAKSNGHLSLVTIFPCDEADGEPSEMFTVDLIKTSQGGGDRCEESDDEDYSNYNFIPVKVLHVESPQSIYVHFPEQKSLMNKLDTLQMDLQAHHIKTDLETRESWQVGDMAVAYCEKDRQFYRITIEAALSDGLYKVFSRDFAFHFNVDVGKIGKMDDYFKSQPPFAYRCHLSGVKPIGKNWSLTSTDFLKDLLMNKKNLFFAKTGDVENKSTPALFCFKTCKPPSALEPVVNKIENINKQLAINGLAIEIKSERKKVVKKFDWYEECCKNIVEVKRDVEVFDTVAVSSSIDLYDKQTNCEISLFGSDKCTNYKFDNADEVPIDCISKNNIYTPKHKSAWLSPLAILKKEFSSVATYVDERAFIYLHYISEIDTLNKISEIMTEYFITPEVKKHIFEIGDRCSVRYRDQRWYRGVLMGYNQETDEFKVCMIDYGNIEEVPFTDLRKEVAFPNIPILAKRIQLNDVYPISGNFNTSQIDVLHKLIVDFEIQVKILDDSQIPFKAQVYKNQLNINKFMITDLPNCTNKIKSPQSNTSTEEDVIIEDEALSYTQADLPKDEKFLITLINVLSHGQVVFEVNEFNKNPKEFKQLSAEINKHGDTQPLLLNIELDQPCIAKFSEDQVWYRGKIFKKTKDTIIVLFVDYGNIEIVERKDIRAIKQDWLSYPLIHYIAYVNYFKDLDENDDSYEISLKHLSEYYDKEKRAMIINEHPLTIDIYEVNEDVLSYASLIEEGVFD